MLFKFEHYLDRIGLSDVPPGAAGLAALQAAHMRAIPFENIDPLLGQVPSLAIEDIVAKLVHGGRGGYCFEQNALFGAALTAFGYAPLAVLARVHDPSGQSGARSHHAFVVAADGTNWLCDTGFGGAGALDPLDLSLGTPQAAANGTYRVRVDRGSGVTTLDREAGGVWTPLYAFDAAPVKPVDFEAANYLCARWDGAPFSANLMLAFHAPDGRVGLFNRALTRGMRTDAVSTLLGDVDDLAAVLCDTCGLGLRKDQLVEIWDRIASAPTRR